MAAGTAAQFQYASSTASTLAALAAMTPEEIKRLQTQSKQQAQQAADPAGYAAAQKQAQSLQATLAGLSQIAPRSGADAFDLSQPGVMDYAYARAVPQLEQKSAAETYAQQQPQTSAQGATAAGQYWQSVAGQQGGASPYVGSYTDNTAVSGAGMYTPQAAAGYNPQTYSAQAQGAVPGAQSATGYQGSTAVSRAAPGIVPQGNAQVQSYAGQTATGAYNQGMLPGQSNVAGYDNQTRTSQALPGLVPGEINFGDVGAQTSAGRYAATLDPNSVAQQDFSAVGQTASTQSNEAFQNTAPADMSGYYGRQFDVGSDRLDRAMAARGMYSSSAAIDAQRELASDLGATQARDEAEYGLQRAAEARQSAGAADTSTAQRFGMESDTDLARQRLGLDAARAADEAALGLYGAEGDYGLGRGALELAGAGQADEASLARFNAETGYDLNRADLGLKGATATDEAALRRFLGETGYSIDKGDLALRTSLGEDQSALGYFGAQSDYDLGRAGLSVDAAQNADQARLGLYGAELGRGELGLNTSTAIEDAALQRYLAESGVDISRMGALTDAARSADQSAQGYVGTGLDVAQSADKGLIDRITGIGTYASGVDMGRVARADTMYGNLSGTSANLANQYSGMYSDSINQDQALYDMVEQLGLGSAQQLLAGSLQNAQLTGAQMQQLQSAAAAGDQTAMSIVQMLNK